MNNLIPIVKVINNLIIIYCLSRVLCNILLIRFNLQYHGHDLIRIRNVINTFALEPETLIIKFKPIESSTILAPVLGSYEPETKTITIDSRVVRGKRMLMKVLLHEIAHFNQDVQGRLALTTEKVNIITYWFRPEEIEARGFARAWRSKALKIYNSVI